MDIREIVNRSARLYRDRPAITSEGRSLTYGMVHERTNRLANGLLAMGLQAGERIAILTHNDIHFLEYQFAAAKCAFVQVPLNARLSLEEQIYILNNSEAAMLLYSEEFAGPLQEIRTAVPSIRATIRLGAEGDDSYEAFLAAQSTDEPPALATADASPLYILFYSSGTTGQPKGVMLTQANWLVVAELLLLEYTPMHRSDVILHLQPLTHGGGFFLLPAFARGAHSIVPRRYEPRSTLRLIEQHRATILKLVPTMLVQLLQEEQKFDLRSLKHIVYGASPMPYRPLQRALEVFGPILTQLYGQAECPMTISVLPESEHVRADRLRSAGRPCLLTEVRVVDEDGSVMPPGEVGEITVRGPQMMQGYWANPEMTRKTMRDGWIYTGDLGFMDDEGYVFLVDRRNDMIISGGFNVYPREIEDWAYTNPSVLEAACVGVPDDTWGQVVGLVVVPKAGADLSQAEIEASSREHFPTFKRPRVVRVVDAIPKNANGKIARKDALAYLLGLLERESQHVKGE